jgi:4-amino-4-deoxy-L-arabinose transferase-like glycosyltransferase
MAGNGPAPAQDAARWRVAFWSMWALLVLVKVALAATLAPFGDEAWYWQESRALAWSYSDLPLATAWLIRAGESVFGHGVLAMRAPFLLLGALLPLVIARTTARLFGARAGWQAGLLTLALPLSGTLGLFALPDVPLTLCSALALDAFERAARTRALRAWCVLGIALAGAWLSHYRAAMLIATGLVFLAAPARGRTLWSARGLWLALALAVLGMLPLLVFNLRHDWVALGFQLLERNPWRFHADALVQPLEQALVCTPLFYGALLGAAWACARRARQGEPWDLLATAALVPIVAYFVLGCFADDTRLRLHWPLPGYLPLLIALPPLLAAWTAQARGGYGRKLVLAATFVVLAGGSAIVYAYFVLAAVPGGATVLAGVKAFPEHWVGWNEVAAQVRARLAQPAFADAVLVADNFMLAAELDFAFDGSRPVYTLDHPLNAKHGRTPQLALWHRDEAGLRLLGARRLLLVAEPTTRRERERAQWLASLCDRVDGLTPAGRLDLYGGRKRYLFFSATVRPLQAPPGSGGDCVAGKLQ